MTPETEQPSPDPIAEADKLADEVRQLRLDREAVPWGPMRRRTRKLIGLQIEARRWRMHILNPKKYRPVRVRSAVAGL